MKKFLFTLGFIFAFGVFTSCSVDDAEPTQSVDQVKMKYMENISNSNKGTGESEGDDSLSTPPPPPVLNVPDTEIDPPKPAPKPEN
jgi:hypothetical protein